MPIALAMGIATVSATIARIKRSSLVASRKSRRATNPAREMWREMPAQSLEPNLRAGPPTPSLCRSRFSKLMVGAHDREVDVLQRRQLAKLATHLESRATADLGHVADRERATRGHDSDLLSEDFGLFHVVCADDERVAVLLQVLQVVPRAP